MIVGIPTRDRPARAAALADAVAPHCDLVVLAYRGMPPKPKQENVSLVTSSSMTLREARSMLMRKAIAMGEQASFQLDDDISVADWQTTLDRMEDTLTDYPYLGAVCTCPWFYWGMGAKNDNSNTGFNLVSAAFQFWAIRTEAIQECGVMDVESGEDLEYGYRLWDHGWGVGRLTGIEGTHKVLVPRMNKPSAAGGQPVEEREVHLPLAMKLLEERYPHLVKVGLTNGAMRKATHYQRPNWSALLERLRSRWGHVGYRDSRGRIA